MNAVGIVAAKYLFLAPVLVLGGYFLRQPWETKKRMAWLAVPSLLLTYAAGTIGNLLYSDPRPFVVMHSVPLVLHAPDNGFPSDHTLLLAALAALATYWEWRLGILLWIIALSVGVARVYVGLHHPIDVIGSIVIAVVATTAARVAVRQFQRRR